MKITALCHEIDKLLVFIERNTKEINLIFLNKDDIYYYYIENNNNLDVTIMSLKRKLYNETNCVVCMEQCINKYYMCSKCGHQIHNICFKKCDKSICSICNHFMYNE